MNNQNIWWIWRWIKCTRRCFGWEKIWLRTRFFNWARLSPVENGPGLEILGDMKRGAWDKRVEGIQYPCVLVCVCFSVTILNQERRGIFLFHVYRWGVYMEPGERRALLPTLSSRTGCCMNHHPVRDRWSVAPYGAACPAARAFDVDLYYGDSVSLCRGIFTCISSSPTVSLLPVLIYCAFEKSRYRFLVSFVYITRENFTVVYKILIICCTRYDIHSLIVYTICGSKVLVLFFFFSHCFSFTSYDWYKAWCSNI